MTGHVIHPIPLVKIDNWSPYVFSYLVLGRRPDIFVSFVWYIEGPSQKILVDAGSAYDQYVPFIPILTPGASGANLQTIEQGLSKFGFTPEDIDIVILTHMHLDHTFSAKKFTNAKFIVQKNELDFATNPHPVLAHIYNKELFEGLNFEVIEGDKEIIDGVRVIFTPGHTPGSQSVGVTTEKGTVVISGICSVAANYYPPKELAEMMPILTPGIHTDAMQAFDSVVKIKEVADIILPLHEGELTKTDRVPGP